MGRSHLDSLSGDLFYHQDLNLWRQEIINAIQNQQLENMDWDNLIDEINDMTASERRNTVRLSRKYE